MRHASLFLVAALATACGATNGLPPHESSTFDAFEQLTVQTVGSRVEVSAGDDDAIVIDILAGDGGDTWVAEEDGDTLVVEAQCSDGEVGCGVGFLITVPRGTGLDLRAENGEVAVKGDLEGDIHLQTTSGDVVGVDLGPVALDVLTNGQADVSFADTPRDVSLDGGAGDLNLAVPPGSYDVQFAGSGDTELDDAIVDDDAGVRLYLQSSGTMRVEASE